MLPMAAAVRSLGNAFCQELWALIVVCIVQLVDNESFGHVAGC